MHYFLVNDFDYFLASPPFAPVGFGCVVLTRDAEDLGASLLTSPFIE